MRITCGWIVYPNLVKEAVLGDELDELCHCVILAVNMAKLNMNICIDLLNQFPIISSHAIHLSSEKDHESASIYWVGWYLGGRSAWPGKMILAESCCKSIILPF